MLLQVNPRSAFRFSNSKDQRFNSLFILLISVVLLQCSAPKKGFQLPSGLKTAPVDSSWRSVVFRSLPEISARGRVSLPSAPNLPFTLHSRGDSLEFFLKSRVGTSVGAMLVTTDSVFLYDATERTLFIRSKSAAAEEPLLLAGLYWNGLLSNDLKTAHITSQKENKSFVLQEFSNKTFWVIRKADSTVVFRQLLPDGTAVTTKKTDLARKWPLEFEIASPSLEMPIFARVSAYTVPESPQKFQFRYPAKTTISRL